MIPVVRLKEGVQFTGPKCLNLTPGMIRMLSVLDQVAGILGQDLWITAACNGVHSGPDDPHYLGKALDVRSKNLADPHKALSYFNSFLGTAYFYVFLEDEGTDNVHFHMQIRKGIEYPPNATH